jgi:hypothetical protein
VTYKFTRSESQVRDLEIDSPPACGPQLTGGSASAVLRPDHAGEIETKEILPGAVIDQERHRVHSPTGDFSYEIHIIGVYTLYKHLCIRLPVALL